MTNLSIFNWFYNVFWSPLNAPFGSLPMPSGILIFGRSRNVIKIKEELRTPSNADLQNDDMFNTPLVLYCFWIVLNTHFGLLPRPAESMNCGRSGNAIKCHEKLAELENGDIQSDDIFNTPLVLYRFLNTAQHLIWVASKASWKHEFRLFLKSLILVVPDMQ